LSIIQTSPESNQDIITKTSETALSIDNCQLSIIQTSPEND